MLDALNLYLDGDKSKVIDIDNVERNMTEFPNFFKAEQWSCDLIPGDILYIPALWFHNMTAKDYGVAINVFWKNCMSIHSRKCALVFHFPHCPSYFFGIMIQLYFDKLK